MTSVGRSDRRNTNRLNRVLSQRRRPNRTPIRTIISPNAHLSKIALVPHGASAQRHDRAAQSGSRVAISRRLECRRKTSPYAPAWTVPASLNVAVSASVCQFHLAEEQEGAARRQARWHSRRTSFDGSRRHIDGSCSTTRPFRAWRRYVGERHQYPSALQCFF